MLGSLLPLACPGCGAAVDARAPVCGTCAAALRAPPPAPPPPGVDRWAAPFAYDGTARELIARVKYRGAHAAVAWMADAMAPLVGPPLPTVVTWAPTTPARRRARGFDHAQLLACALARRIGRPAARLLRRLPGPPQTGLRAAERRVGPVFRPIIRGWRRIGGVVLLVDDVATTGATLGAAAACLRAGGATGVVAITAARTPPR